MRAYERLLQYVKIYTTSIEDAETTPSAEREFDLARPLCDELIALGLKAEIDEHCYVMGWLDATPGYEDAPCVGFIAHVDTAPDFSGEGVKPRVIENYDGKDVLLGDGGRVLSASEFPHLPGLAGRTLIVTDGTTLLGADDKAGIAEIMTLLEELTQSGAPHGRIAVCFTPDEEVGCGTLCFDINRFGADFAYTIDGGFEGEVVSENFNAAAATVSVAGFNVHPGEATGIMKNACLIASEFAAAMPKNETPATTAGRVGFYHLTDLAGNVEAATLRYILRDHDAKKLEEKKQTVARLAKEFNQRYGDGTVTVEIRDQYRNMKEKIDLDPTSVELALAATRECGVEPICEPIRGGTDGAMLTWQGLPCPNLGTGGFGFHGPYEHVTAEGMDTVVRILHAIVRRTAEPKK
ncbi:MAG: peptidase T [Clostridia bacterium]|nr:peptidase T [Clostridia bacterium]